MEAVKMSQLQNIFMIRYIISVLTFGSFKLMTLLLLNSL